MKVKATTFFYNTDLLRKICNKENNCFLSGQCFVKTLVIDDYFKLIGDDISAIVKLKDVGEKDCNGYHMLTVELVKVIPGELEIEYDI